MSQRELFAFQIFEQAIEADTTRSVLPNVKVIGANSANRRIYLPECLRAALPLYEGAKVKIDHKPKPGETRSVTESIGWLENCRLEGDSIYADLHYNPKNSFAEELVWWAKNKPSQLGLSHNAVGVGSERKDGILEITKIVQVCSVDLVDDPATTNGLFEHKGTDHKSGHKEKPKVKIKFKAWMEHIQGKIASKLSPVKKSRLERCVKEMDDADKPMAQLADMDMEDPGDSDDPTEALTKGFETAMIAILRDTSMDAKGKAKKIAKYLKQHEKLLADDSAEPDDPDEPVEEEDDDVEESKKNKKGAGKPIPESVQKELDELRAAKKLGENRSKGQALCVAAKLPALLVTEHFLGLLARCESEADMKAMIEDRKLVHNLANTKQPTSAPPTQSGAGKDGQKPADLKSFKEQLYKGTGVK